MPEKLNLSDDKSSLKNETFALNSISEMLKMGSIKEVQTPPKLITPLSVSENSLGKKHFISDLRFINEHTKTRLNSMIRIFLKLLRTYRDVFVFKFNFKSGSHHINVFEEHQTHLGFFTL